MNIITKVAGIAVIGFACILPMQQAQACSLAELQTAIQNFLASVKNVDPVLYAQVEQERKASIAKFQSAIATAWKEYVAELAAREKEYIQLLKEYVLAQFSKERAKLLAQVNVKIDAVKAKIKTALAKYKVKIKAFEDELADRIQTLISNLARA